MGTRSLTRVQDEYGRSLCEIYGQYDGYIEQGLGQELVKFCNKFNVINGMSGDTTNQANGMGCFAAQLIKHLKEGCGNVYLNAPLNYKQLWRYQDRCWAEYVYTITEKDGKINVACYDICSKRNHDDLSRYLKEMEDLKSVKS